MYLPPHFEQHDRAALHALIRRHPLGTLVVQGEDGLVADHLPFLLLDREGPSGALHAHVPRANPLTGLLAESRACLAIFHGAEGYISPSGYATKRVHGKVVPTWNSAVVHVHGRVRMIDEPAWVRAQVEALTAQQEGPRSDPWAVSDAPEEFVAQMLAALVGLEVRIERLVGKTKASQNQPPENRRSVLAALDAEPGSEALREMMRDALGANADD